MFTATYYMIIPFFERKYVVCGMEHRRHETGPNVMENQSLTQCDTHQKCDNLLSFIIGTIIALILTHTLILLLHQTSLYSTPWLL